MKRLTKQEEKKYAAELEEALKQFSELKEQAKKCGFGRTLRTAAKYKEQER